MDLRRGFVVEYQASGLQSSSSARVMGQNLGPENGMDRTSVSRSVSIGSESLARISRHVHHSHPDGCPRYQQETHLLESGGGLCEVESIVPLAVCEFERDLSASSEFPAVRPLHVYCNVGTSSMVGGRITDLLREIKYQPQNTTHFEPRHIQYVPVRNEVVEIVETQMAETNGDLVQFGEGRTLLTLHFKRDVVV